MKINFYVGFNNYYNRKVIVHDSLDDYQDYLLLTIPNVNFKPKDGINTDQIVNTTQAVDYQVFNLSNTPDYAIVADDDNTIISRWFVTQYESLIYKNQYRAVLRRDVIADNYDAVIEAPVFIEKATITDKQDPALFNSENMGFNQIKTSETLLKDWTECPWIVGFVPSNTDWNKSEGGQITYNGPELTVSGPLNTETTYTLKDCNGYSDFNWTMLNNIPCKMFCMPYANLDCYYGALTPTTFTTNKDIMLAFATSIAKTIGSGNILDVQLLPYCPLRRYIDGNYYPIFLKYEGGFDQEDPRIGKYQIDGSYLRSYTIVNKSDQTQISGVFFWCDVNKFTFDITCSLPLPDTALEMKVKNETDMYRLCSPNYNGQFEFNPMKNGGITKINVDCMYQPYNPYIHMNPDFGSLYGEDYNDARGLICQGDFSLPQETSAWANYVQNNKNYQNIFDRQIQNMERMNEYQMTSQIASMISGTLQGGAQGMFLTGGNPIGAIGAGVASAGAGIVDTIMLANQQKETLDYTKDQFGYQLGNIKAIPNNISKTNPFTNNNKIFPVLEYYTCTDTEKDALEDKMTYNGMTVMRIGKIKDWLLDDYSYIKGKLIMFDSSIEEDYHTVIEIAQELDKGIRAKKEEA